MMRCLLHALSPAATRGRLSILIFHRVLPDTDPLLPDEMHRERFRAICSWVRRWFNVLPLEEACRLLRQRALPARALAITFDDGYADNHDIAVPVLLEQGLPATFFVATGFLDGGRMWNDTLIESVRRTKHEELNLQDAGLEGITRLSVRDLPARRAAVDCLIRACRYLPGAERDAAIRAVAAAAGAALPTDLMMSSAQIRSMRAQGMALGGHTVSHPILTRLAAVEARQEIEDGKRRLEELVQERIALFAYPNGRPGEDFGPEHVAMVERAGFEAAVTTAWGVSSYATPNFQLPRFTPWDQSRWRFGLRLARNVAWPQLATRFV